MSPWGRAWTLLVLVALVATGCPSTLEDPTEGGSLPEGVLSPAGICLDTDVHSGDLWISSAAGVAALSKCREVTGSLYLVGLDGGLSVEVPGLERVHGSLVVMNGHLSSLRMPQLERVGELIISDEPILATLSMDSLRTIDGTLGVSGIVGLEALALPRLEDAARVSIGTCPPWEAPPATSMSWSLALVTVDLPALEGLYEGVAICKAPALLSVSLPALGYAFEVVIRDVPLLQTVDLSSLETVVWHMGTETHGGSFLDLDALATVGGSLSVASASSGVALSSLAAVGGDLALELHGAAMLDLPALTSVGGSVSLDLGFTTTIADVPLLPAVSGSLTITGPSTGGVTKVSLASVVTIAGDVVVEGGMDSLSLDQLEQIGGALRLVEGQLELIELPSLEEATSLSMEASTLSRVWAPVLASLAGGISLTGGALYDGLDVPSLQTVGSLVIDGTSLAGVWCPSLTSVEGTISLVDSASVETVLLPLLEAAGGDVHIESTAALDVVIMSSLNNVAGSLSVQGSGLEKLLAPSLRAMQGSLEIVGNQSLIYVDMPDLEVVDDDLTVADNHVLDELLLPSLETVGGAYCTFTDNSSLGICSVEALLAQVEGQCTAVVSGNDDVEVCQ